MLLRSQSWHGDLAFFERYRLRVAFPSQVYNNKTGRLRPRGHVRPIGCIRPHLQLKGTGNDIYFYFSLFRIGKKRNAVYTVRALGSHDY